MKKKKVMVLGMSPHVGGVESYIMNILRNIDRSKYTFYFPYYNSIAYREEIIKLGGKLIQLKKSRHKPISYMIYLYKLFKKYSFDAVYYNTCDIMSMDMIMFGKWNNVPIRIIHSHNSDYIIPPNFFHRFTEKWCKNHLQNYATHLLACSKKAGAWMFDGLDYTLVHNGIDTMQFAFSKNKRKCMRKELDLEDCFLVGFVGSLWNQKNPLFLIEIFKSIYKKNKNARLLVVGDGELKDEMIQRTKKYNIEHKVIFLGIRNDIKDILNAFDCFVLPSNFEGLPFVLVEAQTNGLPCIASDRVSNESNITGEVDYLSLDLTSDEWADHILSKNNKFDRIEYANMVKQKGYDIRFTVEQIERIFDKK